MHKAMAQPNASAGELQSKLGFDIWPLSLPSLFIQGLQWMIMLKKREQAEQGCKTTLPVPSLLLLHPHMSQCWWKERYPAKLTVQSECLWQHFWNRKAVPKPKLLLKCNLWPTRQEVFGVELRKLAFSSSTELGHPNSLWSCCFKNDVFQHSVVTEW